MFIADGYGLVILIGQDGVQRPPIRFPTSGSLLSFLNCLENGLYPHGQLDPPLFAPRVKGLALPSLTKSGTGNSSKANSQDYVFRLVSGTKPEDIGEAEKRFCFLLSIWLRLQNGMLILETCGIDWLNISVIHSCICSFFHSRVSSHLFVSSLVRPSVHPFIQPLILCAFLHLLFRALIHSLAHSLVSSLC